MEKPRIIGGVGMMWKKFNLKKYIGFMFFYVALSLSGSIDLTMAQYALFVIGASLMSLDKEVAE